MRPSRMQVFLWVVAILILLVGVGAITWLNYQSRQEMTQIQQSVDQLGQGTKQLARETKELQQRTDKIAQAVEKLPQTQEADRLIQEQTPRVLRYLERWKETVPWNPDRKKRFETALALAQTDRGEARKLSLFIGPLIEENIEKELGSPPPGEDADPAMKQKFETAKARYATVSRIAWLYEKLLDFDPQTVSVIGGLPAIEKELKELLSKEGV